MWKWTPVCLKLTSKNDLLISFHHSSCHFNLFYQLRLSFILNTLAPLTHYYKCQLKVGISPTGWRQQQHNDMKYCVYQPNLVSGLGNPILLTHLLNTIVIIIKWAKSTYVSIVTDTIKSLDMFKKKVRLDILWDKYKYSKFLGPTNRQQLQSAAAKLLGGNC